jgi:hypothetical protein
MHHHVVIFSITLSYSASRCHIRRHAVIFDVTLSHSASRCHIRRHVLIFGVTLSHSASCCHIRRHIVIFGSMLSYSASRHIRRHVVIFGGMSYSASRCHIRRHVVIFSHDNLPPLSGSANIHTMIFIFEAHDWRRHYSSIHNSDLKQNFIPNFGISTSQLISNISFSFSGHNTVNIFLLVFSTCPRLSLSGTTQCRMRRWIVSEWVNQKGVGRKRLSPYRGNIVVFLEGLRRATWTLVRTPCTQSEFRTRQLSDTSTHSYCYGCLSGLTCLIRILSN